MLGGGRGVTWDELSSHPGRSSNIPSRFILRKPQCAPAGWGTWLEYRHNLLFFSPFFSIQYSVFPVSGTLLKNNQGQEKLIRNKLLSLVFSRSCFKDCTFHKPNVIQIWTKQIEIKDSDTKFCYLLWPFSLWHPENCSKYIIMIWTMPFNICDVKSSASEFKPL